VSWVNPILLYGELTITLIYRIQTKLFSKLTTFCQLTQDFSQLLRPQVTLCDDLLNSEIEKDCVSKYDFVDNKPFRT